ALCAPLLVAVGVGKIRAVTLPLIGYHWAVGFGSVGSSFYMGTLTARLDPTQTDAFASSAAVVLGANAILAGVLVAVMEGGWRGLRVSWPLLATVGPAMAVAQWLVVSHVPAIGALCAGATGIVIFLGVQLLRSKVNAALPREAPTDESPGAAPTSAKRASADSASAEPARSGDVAPVAARDTALDEPVGERPSTPSGGTRRHGVRALTAAAPHLALAALALAVLVPPASRQYVTNHLLIGPSFPSTTSGRGVVNDAVHTYNPIALLGHPGTFLLAGCLVGLIVWRIAGVWPRGAWAAVRKPWITQALKASPSVVLLAAIAGVLVDSGMIRAIALGAAAVAGPVYPVFAPLLGALGSFITGSTTSSNALFSALQRDVAMLIDVPPSDLLAA
ncbi:MAG: L-lactate permease, partial [Micromonosporaceae bacterium]